MGTLSFEAALVLPTADGVLAAVESFMRASPRDPWSIDAAVSGDGSCLVLRRGNWQSTPADGGEVLVPGDAD